MASSQQIKRWGNDTYSRSTGAQETGAGLALNGTQESGLKWAEYELGNGSPQAEPTGIRVFLNSALTTEAWIAVADFSTRSWSISGPFSSSHTVEIGQDELSPQGYAYVAVIVYGENSALIEQVALYLAGGTNAPPNWTRIQPSLRYGEPGTAVTLTAQTYDTNGYVARHEWDLDGDGSYELDSGENPVVETALPGFQGRTLVGLRVTDNDGAVLEARRVALSTTARQIESGVDGTNFSSAMVGGKPAVVYTRKSGLDGSTWTLRYRQAINAEGTQWAAPIDLSSPYPAPWHIAFATLAGGEPAVAYAKGDVANPQLYFRRAIGSAGTSWGPEVLVASGLPAGRHALASIDGRPAIVFLTPFYTPEEKHLRYVRALDDKGEQWGTPVLPEPLEISHSLVSLIDIAGRPAIGYTTDDDSVSPSEARYIRSLDADGAVWDSPRTVFASPGMWLPHCSLHLVDGLPAMVIGAASTHYLRAADIEGNSWSGGPLSYAWITASAWNSHPPQLTVVNGKPALYNFANGSTSLTLALDLHGDSWGPQTLIDHSNAEFNVASLLDLASGFGFVQYFESDELVFDRLSDF